MNTQMVRSLACCTVSKGKPFLQKKKKLSNVYFIGKHCKLHHFTHGTVEYRKKKFCHLKLATLEQLMFKRLHIIKVQIIVRAFHNTKYPGVSPSAVSTLHHTIHQVHWRIFFFQRNSSWTTG